MLLWNSLQTDQAPGRHEEKIPPPVFSPAFIALGWAGLRGQVGVGASYSHPDTPQGISAILSWTLHWAAGDGHCLVWELTTASLLSAQPRKRSSAVAVAAEQSALHGKDRMADSSERKHSHVLAVCLQHCLVRVSHHFPAASWVLCRTSPRIAWPDFSKAVHGSLHQSSVSAMLYKPR